LTFRFIVVTEVRRRYVVVSLSGNDKIVVDFPIEIPVVASPFTVDREVTGALGPGSVGVKTGEHANVFSVFNCFQLL
jgi:hypothetical protein